MSLFEDPEALKKFEKTRERVIAQEHSQMPKICSKCGGKMEFARQGLTSDPVIGDILVYECRKCGNIVEKFFEFPKEYARYFEA